VSSTRRADPNAPLSQERYMSSPEFATLRAISGTAVAKRCALLVSPAKCQLLWFIQGISLTEGGLGQLSKELVAMFPKRFVPTARHELGDSHWYDEEESKDATTEECASFAVKRFPRHEPEWDRSRRAQSLEEFLIDLCVNPRLQIRLPGETEIAEIASTVEAERVKEEFPDLPNDELRVAKLVYFRDVVGALVEYKQRYEERAKSEFCLTAIGRQIWKQLDDALKTRTMIVLDGLEGRGKTEAVRAWCNCHLGVARFISLDGTSTKTTQFREFARALGVGHGYTRKVSEMQAGVKDVLRASHLMPVIDEAHFFFNQGPRMYTRPEMLDWIDTALCNPPLPVALVTTPQFMKCLERAASQVDWNYRQFKRRCKRFWRLPPKNTPEDVEAVARHLLPKADRATIKQILAYEALSKRDLSAVGDVVREAKLLADEDGASRVTFEHVKRAIHEVLLVSDLPFVEMEKRLRNQKPGGRALPEAPELAPEPAQERAETQERDINPRLSRGAIGGSRLRFHASDPALETAQDLPVLSQG
jgi:hypothetical protein